MTNLNPEQQLVVDHVSGPLRVGAVAGAGKTTALVERVAALVKKGVDPNRILMISFSRMARDEMKRRIDKRLPGANAGACARTFHSIGLVVFQREADPHKEFDIDTSGLLWLKATERAYRAMSIEPEKKAIIRFAGLVKNNLLGTDEVLRRLGRVDARMLDIANECCKDAEVSAADLLQAFYKAEHIRRTEGIEHNGRTSRFVTFDDMIYQSAMLLRRSDVRDRWATRWDHVLQDEAQDECEAQAAIAGALAHKHRNYMVVGDPAQSIFGFRGSSPERMLQFTSDWPGAKTIVMHRNYRSGIEIVDLANRIMGHMAATSVITDEIGDATMMTSERQTHAHVSSHVFGTARDEAEHVADNIRAHVKDGVRCQDQAVLVRMNRMTRDIEIALATRNIPYRLVSGESFFSMKEAAVLFGYLRVLLNCADEDAFKACVMNPSRKLGNAFIKKVAETHDMNKKDWIASVEKVLGGLPSFQNRMASQWLAWMKSRRELVAPHHRPAEVFATLRTSLKLDEHFKRNLQDQEDSRVSDNLDAIVDFAHNFTSCAEMLDVVQNVARHRAANARKRDAVTITTLHKAKGAEWTAVYVLQLARGLFPSERADLAEERRCFYVACTRAMDELWLSRPGVDSEGEEQTPSRFLDEVGISEQGADTYRTGRVIVPMRVGTQVGLGL